MCYFALFHNLIWTETDGIYYQNFGHAILEGNGKDVLIVNGQIGGPVLFAALNTVFDDAFSIQKFVAIISGSGIVFLSFLISKNIFNFKIAFLTQLFVAFNPILHHVSFQALNELFPMFLIFCALYYITKNQLKLRDYFIIGAFLGVTSIFRMQGFFVLIGFLSFLIFQNKSFLKNLFYATIICSSFFITFSPQIIYNLYTHEVVLDTFPGYYIGNLYVYQTPEWHNTTLNPENSLTTIIFQNFDLFTKNYFYNIFPHNFDRLFNLGTLDNMSIVPLIPLLGFFIFLGGLIYLIINRKTLPKNILPLPFMIMVYFLLVSLVPVYRSYHLLPIWLPIVIISSVFLVMFSQKIKFFINSKSNSQIILTCFVIFILFINIGFSYKLIDSTYYGNDFSTLENEISNIFISRTLYDQSSYEVIEISEILKKQLDIEKSFVMASTPNYSYYSNSNFIYADFTEGDENDTIMDFISQVHWNDFDQIKSNIHSNPPDRQNKFHYNPDYLVYRPYSPDLDTTWYAEKTINQNLIKLLEPTHPDIPKNFELIYHSNSTNTIVYKILK